MSREYWPVYFYVHSQHRFHYLHYMCIRVLFFFCIQTFLKDEKLREFFQIVSTSKDRKGKTFISTMEGKQLHHGKREWKIGTLFPVPLKLFLHHSRLCISIRALWSPRSFTRTFILHKNIHATWILQKNGYYV